MSDTYHALISTPLGWVAVLATSRGIRRLTLPQPSPEAALIILQAAEGTVGPRCDSCLRPLLERLRAFYEGTPTDFSSIPLDMEGRPPFFRRVWETLRASVPHGETITYGELARLVGRPRAARAVGQAMAANPYPPIVPCHRVLAHGGNLGGFGGRPELKRHLLALENSSDGSFSEDLR